MADLILIQSLTQDSVLDNQLQMGRELLWHQLVNSELKVDQVEATFSICFCHRAILATFEAGGDISQIN